MKNNLDGNCSVISNPDNIKSETTEIKIKNWIDKLSGSGLINKKKFLPIDEGNAMGKDEEINTDDFYKIISQYPNVLEVWKNTMDFIDEVKASGKNYMQFDKDCFKIDSSIADLQHEIKIDEKINNVAKEYLEDFTTELKSELLKSRGEARKKFKEAA